MCICIHIHICTRTCVFCMYVYSYVYVCAYLYRHIHIYIPDVCTYAYLYLASNNIRAYVYADTSSCVLVRPGRCHPEASAVGSDQIPQLFRKGVANVGI